MTMGKSARAVRYEEIKGKTVSGFGHDVDHLLIAFTDGTVLALSTQDNGDGSSEIDYEQWCDIDLLSHRWASAADDAGLITREEWREANRAHAAAKAERLRAELARLEGRR
jgi:hypothetical protein